MCACSTQPQKKGNNWLTDLNSQPMILTISSSGFLLGQSESPMATPEVRPFFTRKMPETCPWTASIDIRPTSDI